ncbi:MAG TPA: antibiotic biosynthesis monooxygenase [Thermoleophilaceae bacterium]|jgi:heme-degrading monooxygenase HmoA
MYVSMSHLRVEEERAAELVEAFRGRIGLVDGADGFVDIEVWQSDRDPAELIMVSRWRDREAFKRYMKSEEHRRSHDRIDPSLQEAIRLTRLGHLHTYDVVAR